MLKWTRIVGGSFGFVRRNVGLVAIWCAICSIGLALASLFTAPMIEALLDALTADAPRPSMAMFGYVLVQALVIGLIAIILLGAILRALLRPERRGLAYLRFGADELRLILLAIVMAVITMLLGLVAFILCIPLMFVADDRIFYGIELLWYGLSIYVAVRLSPMAPLTILRRRLVIHEAWRATRGRFRTLAAGYGAVMIMIAVALLPLHAMTTGPYYHQLFEAGYDPPVFAAAMRDIIARKAPGQPMWFLGVFIGGLLHGIAIALVGAMTAVAARELISEEDTARAAR